jgi:hypothetical protein
MGGLASTRGHDVKSWSGTLKRWAAKPAAELDVAALRLVTDAQSAARLRAYRSDPNVAALGIERTRDVLDRWGWTFLSCGLAFTIVNVQSFVAGTAPAWSLTWITAWLVEPMVMGLMLVLLRGEQIANRYGEKAGGWVRFTRWTALLITYVMNTWVAWTSKAPDEIFKHSIPVALVFLAAEALVQQRTVLTLVVDGLGGQTKGKPMTQERPRKAAQQAVEAPGPVPVGEAAPDDLDAPRSLKERAERAFRELADETLAAGGSIFDIAPKAVDDRAKVRPGTSKVSGRMDGFRTRYLSEREGAHEDGTTEAGGAQATVAE